MRGLGITACTLVVLGGGVVIATDRGERNAPTPRAGGLVTAGLAERGLGSQSSPPRAVVRGCPARISGGSKRREDDTIVGPLRFNMQTYSPLRAWRQQVQAGQWLKSPARLRAGAQVTLVVPPEQRSWMRLAYAHGGRGAAKVTLRACRHRRSLAARRRECEWAEGIVGSPGSIRDDYTACRTGPTAFSGGFEIDYDEAPQQGRCAELIVWVKGEEEPHRVRLLRVQPGECAGDPA